MADRPWAGYDCFSDSSCDVEGNPRKGVMQPYQERIVKEKRDLDEKIVLLSQFIRDDKSKYVDLPSDEKLRLLNQQSAMTVYSNILGERIAAFGISNGL